MEPIARKMDEQPKKVLVIDDDPFYLSLTSALFETEGCEVVTVSNGSMGIYEIYSNSYDLVVTDWQMPGLNGGFTVKFSDWVLQAIEEVTGRRKKIPLIISSGMDQESVDIPKTRAFHLLDYWRKKDNLAGMQEKVSAVVRMLHHGF